MDITDNLVGKTVHIARGAQYAGEWELTRVEPAEGYPGWLHISGSGRTWFVQPGDIFETEAQARAAVKARRRPRRPRQPQPLYGDWAQLARLNGIATDGTGRRA